MAWTPITCAERDAIFARRNLVAISTCTDLAAEHHSEPEVFTEWADRGSENPVLRDYRYPARRRSGDDLTIPKPDARPCTHYRFADSDTEGS